MKKTKVYGDVDTKILWDTITTDLDLLKKSLRNILNELDKK
jgi:uncharacterized protein with HEPN domain